MRAIRIGELLVEQGILSQLQVNHILDVQQVSHRPFGDLAERLFGISSKSIEDAWVEQYVRTAGIIDLSAHAVEVDALRTLNRRQAWQFQLLPVKKDETGITAATTKEDLARAVKFSWRKLSDPVAFLIAERKQLREFLMKHYPVPAHMADYEPKI